MTDLPLVAKKLALIETSVGELRSLVHLEAVQGDVRELRFAAYTLHIAIQAALDVAAHIVADNRLGEPQNNRELFELLARYGWISRELMEPLREMVGFRNIVVHGYERLNAAIVESILRSHLDDLLQFAGAIRAQLI
ncbi:MAG TPA: DUF86 domain-containing protein [Thermoanaerobaculia bacterium]